ncbi:MAG: dihydropteroate synthase [Zymomonas mobilis]|uniref:dihydropteroate synthase n=1 Tax=Zymomonas mobilis TaxID=542 RepID=A0A542W1G2_ZYMMB|nr:dihydropteroate synthase [Zymomonas mobilis]TQL17406.1 dihydropteroate synthase [Zymomonas mobilis]
MSFYNQSLTTPEMPDIRLYFCPTAFVNAPIAPSGATFRLAGGLKWFGAFSVIMVSKGEIVQERVISVADINSFLNSLSTEMQLDAYKTISRIVAPRTSFKLGKNEIKLDHTHIVGILNITPDSFSDGGLYQNNVQSACETAKAMIQQGASLIDVGGESTRPGAEPVTEEEEKLRVMPVIDRLRESSLPISVDTRKASVISAVWEKTPAIFNDVSALSWDKNSLLVAAEKQYPVILMHHEESKDHEASSKKILIEVYNWLEKRIAVAEAAGISRDRIIIDPGIGFGKSFQDNLVLIRGIALFHGLGCPLMLGASRKKLIITFAGDTHPQDRLGGSLAIALHAADQGVQLLRVHDVRDTAQALTVWQALY